MAKTIVLAVLWATVIWRAPSARRRDPKRTMWLALAALACAMTFDLPPVITAVDGAAHVTDVATLVKHLLAVAACTALIDWTIATSRPPRLRRPMRHRHAITIAIALVLAALFLRTPRVETTDFSASAVGNSWAIAYLLTFELYLAFAMVLGTQMFAAAWPSASSRPLRAGLKLLTAGTVTGAAFAVTRSAALISSLITGSRPDGPRLATALTDNLQALAIALMLIGLALPAAATGHRTARNTYRLLRLRALWAEVTEAVPHVRLFDRRSLREEFAAVRVHGLHLVRAYAETRDGARHLHTYLTAWHLEHIRTYLAEAGLTGEDLHAHLEACLIAAGLHAQRSGIPSGLSPVSLAPPAGPETGEIGLEHEIRHLRKVAAARRSQLVRRYERQLAAAPDPALAHPGWAAS